MYVRCKYKDGMFPTEYFADLSEYYEKNRGRLIFKGIWVNQEQIIPLDAENGLLKTRGWQRSEGGYIVWINDTGNHKLTPVLIPESGLAKSVLEELRRG